jgi:oligoendopeptidase F
MPDSCPIWSLRDLYDGVDSPAVQTDIAACRKAALALAADWQGKIATISGAELAAVITAYEAILEQLGKVQSHAQLLFAANTNDPAVAKHHQSVREAGSEIGAALLFVELELARLDQDHVDGLLDDAGLARFSPWLRRVRALGYDYLMKPQRQCGLPFKAPM